MTRSYPEPLRVTGPLLSLVLRTEDVWQRHNQFFIEVCVGSQSGFPLLTPIMETYDGPAWRLIAISWSAPFQGFLYIDLYIDLGVGRGPNRPEFP